MGSARPLDYGHWAAHKLESLTRHHLRHGEAVAIGMALDARYSVLAGHLAAGILVAIPPLYYVSVRFSWLLHRLFGAIVGRLRHGGSASSVPQV